MLAQNHDGTHPNSEGDLAELTFLLSQLTPRERQAIAQLVTILKHSSELDDVRPGLSKLTPNELMLIAWWRSLEKDLQDRLYPGLLGLFKDKKAITPAGQCDPETIIIARPGGHQRLKHANAVMYWMTTKVYYLMAGNRFLDAVSKENDPELWGEVDELVKGWNIVKDNRIRKLYTKPD